VLRLSNETQFVGHYHLYIGQEATGTAIMTLLDGRDRIATTHRNHGHVLARGADPGAAMAEILGRATGLNGGRGGTIHLCDPALGFISTSGIVGGCISLGIGGGYACRQLGNGAVSAVFFGDGALEEGVSFEALNIASLWRLPVLFVCENNSTGSWAPGEGYPTLVHASSDLCSIARSVNISTTRVDGADAGAVHAAARDAIARCRAGQGPVFLETVTKRWPGNNPLWPEPVTGATDIRMATGEIAPSGEQRRRRALSGSTPMRKRGSTRRWRSRWEARFLRPRPRSSTCSRREIGSCQKRAMPRPSSMGSTTASPRIPASA
jgi:acetoin:2,6-dichlorophenolindophenol oxidoreductase subunit alpha